MLNKESPRTSDSEALKSNLITSSGTGNKGRRTMSWAQIGYVNFDENEETTKIVDMVCLKASVIKRVLVVPILTICTALFFLLFLYWYPSLRKKFFYNECDLIHATQLYIEGASKC